MTELLLKGGLCYLLGSILGSLIIGRLKGGVDIRTLGSGNAGATNALRTLGKAAALGVLVIDVAKGWVATAIVAPWAPAATVWGSGLAAAVPAVREWSVPVCGLAVMLGHIYPVWFGFRGGKAVATFVGTLIGVGPLLLIPFALTWLAAVVIYGFVSLASILGAVAVAVALGVSRWQPHQPLVTYGVLAMILIVYTHRSNIQRLRDGRESRAMRLWRFGERRRNG
ncbi:MAG: glycerol-3-phosphate 1-O-acyltransferase PlsY [Steroidobacteraceae bacterium]